MMGKINKNFFSVIFSYLCILIIFIGFNFTDAPPPFGWYQQFMPFLNNQSLNDVTFIDSLNGWAVTRKNTPNDSGYILRTTNGGDNWNIINTLNVLLKRVEFINSNTGFVCGSTSSGGYMIKTTNGGLNWSTINISFSVPLNDMFVLNTDTIWIVDYAIYSDIYRTTNGGTNWDSQTSLLGNSINKIYMYNRNIGFACTDFELFKTTNSGTNWIQISGTSSINPFNDMFFADSLVGWKSNLYASDTNMVKTTNGGLNWFPQRLPSGGLIPQPSGIYKFSKNNKDTIRGTGASLRYGPTIYRGIIFTTTNGGDNWLFQLPDTSFGIPYFTEIDFINNRIGWSYTSYQSSSSNWIYTGIHTTVGGDTVYYTGIVQQSKDVPKDFILRQNYPNPFNPRTVIPYSLKSAGYVRIIAYDILGREVQRLVDQKQSAGEYEVDFMGKFCSSGVYFYRMTVDDRVLDTKKMVLLK